MHQTTPHSRTASQELLSPATALRPGNRPGVDSASNDPRSASKDEFHMLWPFRRNRNVGTRAVVATDLLVEEEKGRKERRLEPGEYHIFEFPLLDPKDLLARPQRVWALRKDGHQADRHQAVPGIGAEIVLTVSSGHEQADLLICAIVGWLRAVASAAGRFAARVW
jgi:hypothetical protein